MLIQKLWQASWVRPSKPNIMKRILLSLAIAIFSIATSMAQGEPAPSIDLDSTLRSPYMANLQKHLSLNEDQSRAIAEIHHRYAIHLEMAKQLESEEAKAELETLQSLRKMEILAALDEKQQRQFKEMTNGTMKRNKMKRKSTVVDNPSDQ